MSDRDMMRMTSTEVSAFLEEGRRAQVATIDPDGSAHLVPLSYFFWDGRMAFWTDPTSRKIKNLRRDPRVTALVEAGDAFEEFRAVQVKGRAEVIDNTADVEKAGLLLFERYSPTPLDDTARSYAAGLAPLRVLVVVTPETVVSWDHRKLGRPDARNIGS